MEVTLENGMKLCLPQDIDKNGIAAKGDVLGRLVDFKLPLHPSPAIDLSLAEIKIDWVSPDGLPWSTDIETRTVRDDVVFFSWAVPAPFCQEAGLASFSVRATQDGTVWHSEHVHARVTRSAQPDGDFREYSIGIIATDAEVAAMISGVFSEEVMT